MEPKEIKFENMKNLKYGDMIIMEDPLLGSSTPYVLMSNIDDINFYFISKEGASLMIKSQETIDSFKVKLIDNTHPSWIQDFSDTGKEIGDLLQIMEKTGGLK
jgi:hypothetical protein